MMNHFSEIEYLFIYTKGSKRGISHFEEKINPPKTFFHSSENLVFVLSMITNLNQDIAMISLP